MMRFCAAITLYNPTLCEINSLRAYALFFDALYICDNTEGDSDFGVLDLVSEFRNISLVSSGYNHGLSKGLNLLCDYASSRNFDFVCLLDQDTEFCVDEIKMMFAFIDGFDCEDVAIFCPKILYSHEPRTQTNECLFDSVDWAITSGTFLKLEYFRNYNKFDESYFIDRIEYDYCLCAKDNGYRIVRYNGCYMKQTLGEVKKFLGVSFYHHSPLRNYYIFRNRIYFYLNKSVLKASSNIGYLIFGSIGQICKILFLEPEKVQKLYFISRALVDGYHGRYGRYFSSES